MEPCTTQTTVTVSGYAIASFLNHFVRLNKTPLRRLSRFRVNPSFIFSVGGRSPRYPQFFLQIRFFQAIVFLTVCCLVVVRGQFFDGFDSSFRGFGGGLDAPLQATRDPRQNPGPVVFPPAPPDNGETSGVVVGASGYGFVPPGSSKSI